jgi:transketolase N-terminal domain/subunit
MKKLLILPIVGIVVSMLGVSVLAAGSASKGITATDADGNDVSEIDNAITKAKNLKKNQLLSS